MNNKKIARKLNKIAKELLSVDFPNQKAMNDYLKRHPSADRKNHKVVEFKSKTEENDYEDKRQNILRELDLLSHQEAKISLALDELDKIERLEICLDDDDEIARKMMKKDLENNKKEYDKLAKQLLPKYIENKYEVTSRQELEQIINNCSEDEDLNYLDVSGITDMKFLFADSFFNGDISEWDTSNVEDMSLMFADSEFNGDISNWDVSKVKDMDSMFDGSNFDGDISKWNTSGLSI